MHARKRTRQTRLDPQVFMPSAQTQKVGDGQVHVPPLSHNPPAAHCTGSKGHKLTGAWPRRASTGRSWVCTSVCVGQMNNPTTPGRVEAACKTGRRRPQRRTGQRAHLARPIRAGSGRGALARGGSGAARGGRASGEALQLGDTPLWAAVRAARQGTCMPRRPWRRGVTPAHQHPKQSAAPAVPGQPKAVATNGCAVSHRGRNAHPGQWFIGERLAAG